MNYNEGLRPLVTGGALASLASICANEGSGKIIGSTAQHNSPRVPARISLNCPPRSRIKAAQATTPIAEVEAAGLGDSVVGDGVNPLGSRLVSGWRTCAQA